MIPVIYYIYSDEDKNKKWPDKLCCRPEKGDNIASACGKVLKIESICHRQNQIDGTPYLFLELG